MDWGIYDHYGYAALALLGTFAAGGTMLWVTLRSPWAVAIREFRGIQPPFLGVVGVLFALTLAFLANDTWNAHDRALNTVHQEADSLRSVLALSVGLPDPLKARVKGAVLAYGRSLTDQEWPRLAKRESSPEAAARLQELLELLAGPDVTKAAPPAVHSLMLAQAAQARTARGQRLALSLIQVNPLKWLGMAGLGFLTMISIVMVHVEQAKAEFLAVMIFAAAAAPTAAIVLVQGNPFQPPTQVTSDPIRALLD
jgi:hypothetical protein